ncbi:zinc finger, CCHC-type containing protein [Tanacetum coccineum]
MVLRVEKKPFVVEQPISPTPPADSEYLRSGMRFMMLIMRLFVLCSEYEKGLPKKAATPQVMAIQDGRIQKANKKSLNAKGKGKGKSKGKDKSYISKPKNPKPYAKEHSTKDDACHHCKEVGHYKKNCPAYLAELIKKKKQVGTASLRGERNLKQLSICAWAMAFVHKYGYVKYYKKTVKNGQKQTRERMSDQEAKEIKAEAKEIMPQSSSVNCS